VSLGDCTSTGSAGSVTGKSSRDSDIKKVFAAIGAFFEAHRLFPAPGNYALAYLVITEPDSPAAQAVLQLTGDGLRLSQADADRIRAEFGVEGASAPSDTAESLNRARRQIDDFATIVEGVRAETQAYGADLSRSAGEISRIASDHPAIGEVVRLTATMVERTRATESQLQNAREEAKSLRERLARAEEEARIDPLTQLPNRRAFEDKLAKVGAGGAPCSIAICDVDRFKKINDTHGHAVGDRVLKMVAEVLRKCCDEHMVARIGGEEFVVLFEGLSPPEAGALLDEARTDLASRNFRVRGTDEPLGQVTFSAGVAHCDDRGGQVPLKRADDLLYQAKNSGRNKVLVESEAT
jgi:diguanylate cyclase